MLFVSQISYQNIYTYQIRLKFDLSYFNNSCRKHNHIAKTNLKKVDYSIVNFRENMQIQAPIKRYPIFSKKVNVMYKIYNSICKL